MPIRAGPPYCPGVSTTPALGPLRASRAHREAVLRWLWPLPPLVMAVVVWAAFGAHPGPALGGRGLAVSIALAAFVAGGVGVLAARRLAGSGGVGSLGGGEGLGSLGGSDGLGGPGGGDGLGGPGSSVQVACVAVVLAASVALMWLQPDGIGVAGIFL